ncbi:MAG: metal ABC transporter permease [Proteobacteria bacterium]|nr:metal ABC transporter permease [Pseudomonadota bacterium]
MTDVFAALGFDFMRNALLAGLMAGLTCGIIGTLVVVNRLVFLSGGIAHASYGGVGLAFFFGLAPALGIVGFAILSALAMAAVTLKAKHRADTVIGVMWAVGMALGVILIDLTPGYNADLMSYLFGSILTVPDSDLWLMLALNAVILLTVGFFYHDFLAMSYDEEFAQVRGVPVRPLYYVLLVMIALAVVMVIQVVGLILVIALLTIPPYIAERHAGSLGRMMGYAVVLNLVFTTTGLWLAYVFNLTSGATIIMVAAAGFFISLAVQRLRRNRVPSDAGPEPA